MGLTLRLPFPSVGATENVILLAASAEGTDPSGEVPFEVERARGDAGEEIDTEQLDLFG